LKENIQWFKIAKITFTVHTNANLKKSIQRCYIELMLILTLYLDKDYLCRNVGNKCAVIFSLHQVLPFNFNTS